VEFCLLGPVEVREAGRSVPLGGPKPRAVLAALLLAGGRVVSAQTLIDVVWPDEPPRTAPALIQIYVSTLRKRFAQAGIERTVIVTRAPGYVIDLRPDELDERIFAELVRDARQRIEVGDLRSATSTFGTALALWSGSALGGVGDVLRSQAQRLEELRLSVIEERICVDLRLGREAELATEVRALWNAHPMREHLLGYLMILLYRLGRQGEALAAYAEGREILAKELGVDPGRQLQAVHEAVLTNDEAVLGRSPADAAATGRPATTVVAQLPPAVPDFTGRGGEVAELLGRLRTAGPAVPVCVVSGQGGCGKSALAVHVAHRLVDAFPDGQVYIELRGMSDAPAAPADVLSRVLRDFGVDRVDIPTEVAELSARYRSLLAHRRVLLVLDDAADEQQVRPLLPGVPGSAVLITSRNRLAGLAGTCPTQLAVLAPEAGVALLTSIVGAERAQREQAATERIASLCGYLPLAIRIAGARLASRPGWSVQLLAHRLTDELRRLDELSVGDQEVRAGIELSYRSLDASAGRGLRLVGVLGLPTFYATTMAIMLNCSMPEAERTIELLMDAQLIQFAGTDGLGRMIYRVHDLVRVFGRERAEAQETPADRTAAVRRVLGGWLSMMEQISHRAPSGAISPRSTYGQAVAIDPTLAASYLASPQAWFEAEQEAFVVGVERAAALDLADLAGELASALSGSVFLMYNVHPAWSRTLSAAIGAARRAGDIHGEARLLVELGELKYAQDRYAESRDALVRALPIFRDIGDRQGELSALASLGGACREVGSFAEALGFLAAAHRMAIDLDDDIGIGKVARLSGSVRLEIGDFDLVETDLAESLAAYRRAGSRRGEALTLRTISLLHRARGQYDVAEQLAGRSISLFREVGDGMLTAFGIQAWAKARVRQGKYDGVVDELAIAIDFSRQHGDRFGAALSLRTLGELRLSEGKLDEADRCLTESVALWNDLGLPLFRARTLREVATWHDARGAPTAAAAVRAEALEIFRRYGAREAGELTCRQAALVVG
jgi:DNA-binding SARP family transcriptional activator/tetratricopeptide (TPR) repeat protein